VDWYEVALNSNTKENKSQVYYLRLHCNFFLHKLRFSWRVKIEKTEIRKDYFQDNYVIIAPKRAKRPHKVYRKEEDQLSVCYFCPDHTESQEVVKTYGGKGKDWDVLVIENKYPALTLDNPKAYGKQEVIIETPFHNKEIHELSLDNIVRVIDVYIDRYVALRKMEDIRYVLVFKNEGGKAGASIAHSHSQIMALPMVPPEIEREYEAYAKYLIDRGKCPYCDIIEQERDKNRVIIEDEHFLVFCPYASQFVYGVWFLPKRHINHMHEMTEAEKISLARALKKVLAKLDDIDVAYNYFFHNAVNDEDYHMHLKLEPRPNIWAGLELGTGVIINSVMPEEAAKFYRK